MYNLKIIFRNLKRNPIYSIINIAGLAIGMAASVLIFIWVYNEYSYDRYHKDADRIYRITSFIDMGDEEPWILESSPYILAQTIKQEIPEIENIALSRFGNVDKIMIDDKIYFVGENLAYVNRSWFEMFNYKLLEGSFDAFGKNPFSIILTKSEAEKYFHGIRAVGQRININNTDYTVQAVVKDNPVNSSFQFNVMVSSDALSKNPMYNEELTSWGVFNYLTFIKFRSNADIQKVSKKINKLYSVKLRSLTDMHFTIDGKNSFFRHGNQKKVWIFTLLGILILFTACINYINITTAKANTRAKEIGIRKIMGAKRKFLFIHFIIESLIVSLLSACIALLLIRMFSSQYHSLVESAVLSFSSPVTWTILGLAIFITTILNGIYPALLLSSFKPMNFLKGTSLLNIKDGHLRKGLVIFQFTLSSALIICTLVIYKQMQFIQNMNPGYDREQVLMLQMPFNAFPSMEKETATLQSMKNALQSQSGISSVALCNQEIVNIACAMSGSSIDWNGRPTNFTPFMSVMSADADYMKTLGLKLSDGRWFREGNADKGNVILNETAIRELNIRKPYIGQRFDFDEKKGEIIGIVKDFNFHSLHEKIGPLVIQHSYYYDKIILKIEPGKIPQVMPAINRIWQKFCPSDPFVYDFLDDTFNNLYKSDIKTSQLIFVFSILTIVIAMLGLFGLSTFAVERRTKEIGIRKILGASISSIVHMLIKEFLILIAIAFVIAIPIAWWSISKWLENFAYCVNITIWIVLAGGLLSLVIALLAIGWQAIKAATANPVESIKEL